MELLAVLFIAFLVLIFLKCFSLFFDVAIFAIALPFKILAVVFAIIFGVLFLIPFGIFVGLLGLLLAPLAILAALAPFLLIALGIVLIIRNS